jgi:ADP-ribosylglycohydrolase
VLAGVNSSGDSDSIAAMAGALSERWSRGVENGDDLEQIARQLFAGAGH